MNLPEAHMKRHPFSIAMPVLLSFALAACNKPETATATAPATGGLADSADTAAADLSGTQASVAPDPHDPCRLLATPEVETVLGSKLIGPPYRSSNPLGDNAPWPQDDGSVCWYVGKDNHSITVQAEWENAGAISAGVSSTIAKAEGASKGMLKLQDGTELTGDWDEAKMSGCCSLVAIQGDASVEIEFGGSMATPEQAGELANKALARLTTPLAVSGIAGNAAGVNASNDGSVQLKSAEGVQGPWEAAEQGPIQFNAVRHDASIALRQGGMSIEQIRAIVGHAFDRIEAGGGK